MTYATIQGDTWDMIAHKVYGNSFYTDRIIAANPSHATVVIFFAGTKILIPAEPVAVSIDLPPWKRGRT